MHARNVHEIGSNYGVAKALIEGMQRPGLTSYAFMSVRRYAKVGAIEGDIAWKFLLHTLLKVMSILGLSFLVWHDRGAIFKGSKRAKSQKTSQLGADTCKTHMLP